MNHNVPTNPVGGTPPGDDFLSLAQILNILWRRRLMIIVLTLFGLAAGIGYGIIVKPLYRATATVRPGITNYLANGNPERSWRIKDVVRWYRRSMYRTGVGEAMGWQLGQPAPLIEAEFIPRGVGVQGGNVVTLTMLHVNQGESKQILDASIEVFNQYAEINSVGNSLSLERKNLQNQINQLANDRDNVDIKKDLLDIAIERARRELDLIVVEEHQLELKVQEHAVLLQQRTDKADRLEVGVGIVDRGLEDMDGVLERMRAKEARQGQRDSLLAQIPDTDQLPFLWWEMAQDKTAMTGRLLLSSLELESKIWDDQLMAVDLRAENDAADLAHQAQLLAIRFDLLNRKELVNLTIREKEINRDRTLAQEVVDIDDEIQLIRSRLEVLTSLEKVGVIDVSINPVRPRKPRAAGLLTLAAFLSSICLAFAWEYVSRNRSTIFASSTDA